MLLAAVMLLLLPQCLPEVVQCDIFSFGFELLLSKGICPAFCHLVVVLGDQGFHNKTEGCSACTGRAWDPQWPGKLWGSTGRKVQWF